MNKLVKEQIEQKKYFFEKIIKLNRKILKSDFLKNKYKISKISFIRNRKLPFDIMIWLILQKWVKSLQLRINEFFDKISIKKIKNVTNVAFSLARSKISYKVFIHLNKEWIVEPFYDKKENKAWYKTWKWFRVLAVDWSKLRLPNEKLIEEKYWVIQMKNEKWNSLKYVWWLLSSLYDVENDIVIDSLLEGLHYSERALTLKHIINLETYKNIPEKDLIIFDRWYYSKFLFSVLLSYNKDFLCRISTKSCKEASELFNKNCTKNSIVVLLKQEKRWLDYEKKYWIKIDKKHSNIIKVRFIRVVLDNWDIEVLATSLLDEEKYNNNIFKELYFKRWRIEVYYWILKNNLSLENFSWKSVESIEQDIFSSIYMSNFETLATNATNTELESKWKEKKLKNGQQVNKNISFNAIKNNVFDLLLSNKSTKKVANWIQETFKQNSTQKRYWRSFSRKEVSTRKIVNYYKRKKKQCF